jgi:hypothetical protein
MFVPQVADDRAPGRPEAAVRHHAMGVACLSCSFSFSDFCNFQVADLIELNGLKTRISNRLRIPGYRITGPEMMLGVSAFPYANEKFSDFISDTAAYSYAFCWLDRLHLPYFGYRPKNLTQTGIAIYFLGIGGRETTFGGDSFAIPA